MHLPRPLSLHLSLALSLSLSKRSAGHNINNRINKGNTKTSSSSLTRSSSNGSRMRPRIVAALTGSGKHICNDNVHFYFKLPAGVAVRACVCVCEGVCVCQYVRPLILSAFNMKTTWHNWFRAPCTNTSHIYTPHTHQHTHTNTHSAQETVRLADSSCPRANNETVIL